MIVQSALGKLVEQRRKRLGLSKPELAWRLSQELNKKIDHTYVVRIESGAIGRPARARLEALAKVLELPVGELLKLTDYRDDDAEEVELPHDVVARLSTLSPIALELLMEYVPMAEKLADRLTIGAGVASGDMHTMNIDTSPQKRARLGRELRGEV